MDYEGIKTLLREADRAFPRLRHLWLDAGYRGEDKGADRAEKTLGWSVQLLERPKKPAPGEVLKSWAADWAKEGVALDWQKPSFPKGLQVLPRRWVERTIAWIDHNRRTSKDYERLCASGESFCICCHDPPYDEAVDPPLRTFHTVSEEKFCEVEQLKRIVAPTLWHGLPRRVAATIPLYFRQNSNRWWTPRRLPYASSIRA